MPLVKTTISYEEDGYDRQEVITFQREVDDLSAHDALWYCIKFLHHMQFDCKQLQMITEKDKIISTDI